MKRSRVSMVLASLLFIAMAASVYANPPMGGPGGPGSDRPDTTTNMAVPDDDDFGPGFPPDGPGANDGRDNRKGRRSDGPRMQMDRSMEIFLFANPDTKKILDTHREKMEKIMTTTRASRKELNQKRRLLVEKIETLSARYASDKGVSKELVQSLQELAGLQDRIRDMNRKAMNQIEELNQKLDAELQTSREAWLKKLENDPAEMARFTEWMKNRPAPSQKPDRQGPPQDNKRPQR